jgi:hypothetical protein
MTLVVAVVFDEQFNSITSNLAFELYLSSLVEDPLFKGASSLGRGPYTGNY